MDQESLLKIQEQARNRGLVTSAAIILLSSVAIGLTNIFSTVTLPLFLKENATNLDVSLDMDQGSWFVSIMFVSSTLGVWSGGLLSDALGRKKTLLLTNTILIVGWTLISYASNFETLLFGRFLTGFSAGINKIVKYVYLSELSTIHWRGALGALNVLTINAGMMLGFPLGKWLPLEGIILATAMPSVLFVVLALFFLPESPLWLVKNGREKEVKWTLGMLRGANYPSDGEIKELNMLLNVKNKEYDTEKPGWNSPVVWKPVVLLSCIFFLHVLVGSDTLTYYSLYIFGISRYGMDPSVLAILIQLAFTAGFIVSVPCLVRFRRRSLLMGASFLFGACLIFIGTTLENKFFSPNLLDFLQKTMHPLVLVIACVIFGIGVGPVVFSLFGEIFHPQYKGVCSGLTYSVREWTVFSCLKLFPSVESSIGLSGVYILHGTFGIAMCLFVFLFMPETKDLSLTEITHIYKPKKRESHEQMP